MIHAIIQNDPYDSNRPDRIAFYLYDRDDANDSLYDKWKLSKTTHMTESQMTNCGNQA